MYTTWPMWIQVIQLRSSCWTVSFFTQCAIWSAHNTALLSRARHTAVIITLVKKKPEVQESKVILSYNRVLSHPELPETLP